MSHEEDFFAGSEPTGPAQPEGVSNQQTQDGLGILNVANAGSASGGSQDASASVASVVPTQTPPGVTIDAATSSSQAQLDALEARVAALEAVLVRNGWSL